MIAAVNELSPGLFWAVYVGLLAPCWLAFRCIARGWTQVRTERSIHRHTNALARIHRHPAVNHEGRSQ